MLTEYSLLYKQSAIELKTIKKYLLENLYKGFIKSSKALFILLILFIEKLNSSLWFCMDYWKLNTIIKKDQYSLLLIDETLEQLSQTKIFIKINIWQAFYKIWIDSDSEDLTTFRTCYRSYKFKILLFELTNRSVMFQHFINNLFINCLDSFLTTFIDNLLIYSQNKSEHILQVKLVLD